MQVVETREEARNWVGQRRAAGETIAFVPTMGFLHEGHASLLEIGRASADRLVLSIFVNPLQFGPSEDFERYPRDLARDVELARRTGVDVVFAPTVGEMYPRGDPWVTVVPKHGDDLLCGRSRPGHFQGVLTVVAKLFGILRPDLAVFGRKDFQQLVLVRRMVADLEMGIRIVAGPTVRDADGLALSSRNRYLSSDERQRAVAIPAALLDCQRLFDAGERDAAALRARMRKIDGEVDLEYAEIVDPLTLEPLEMIENGAVCALAARIGRTRLIDNVVLGSEPDSGDLHLEAESVAETRPQPSGR